MAGFTKIEGFEEVMSNLNKEIQAIEGRTLQGLIKAAIIIRRDMDHTPPLIPVLTGNLRASWFVVSAKGLKSENPTFTGDEAEEVQNDFNNAVDEAKAIISMEPSKSLFIVIGFGANYSAAVHEMYGKGDITWTRPNSGPKYFESAVKRNKDKIIKTIADNAKIK
jgi:hypothetical protein